MLPVPREVIHRESTMLFPSIFAILVGLLMIVQWLYSFLNQQIPELETERFRILFHIAGEMITAISLIVGGVGLLTGQSWGNWLYLLAMGMLFYTVIVSPGYFAQKGQWAPVAMFAVILILALVSVLLVL
jgi:hypothetical protein